MITLYIIRILLYYEFMNLFCLFVVSVNLRVNFSLECKLRWKINLMMHFIKKFKEIITICPCTLLFGSYMFLNLPNSTFYLFERLIKLFNLFSFLSILQIKTGPCFTYPFPIFTNFERPLLFHICPPKKIAYPCMSFLDLASEALLQSPNR